MKRAFTNRILAVVTRLVILVGFFCAPFILAGQSPSMDSLSIRLQNANPDSSRVYFLCELSNKFLTYRPKQSKQYAEEALMLSRKINFKRGEMLALSRLGESEFRQSNYALSVEHLTQSLKLSETLHDSLAMAGVYRILGNVNTLGFKQYDKALKYQLLALSIYEKRNDKRSIASLYGNVSWIYAITNQKQKEAYSLAKRGAHMADSMGVDQLLGYNYNSLGLIFKNAGDYDSSLYYLNKSSEIGTRIMDRSLNSYNSSIKGNIYLSRGEFNKALNAFSFAENESRDLNSREVLKDSYGGLARTYESLGDYPLAYEYYKRFTELKDSLVNWEITQKTLVMESELNQRSRENKIIELQQSAERQSSEKKIYIGIMVTGFVSSLFIIGLIVRNNRQRKKANELLLEKNNEIARQNLQLKHVNDIKDKLFFIIGHDMRGPLSSLKSLLGMVARQEVSDQEFKMLAPQLNQHVVGVSETIENLLQWSGSQLHGWQQQQTDFQLRASVEKAIKLFSESALRKQISLTNEVAEDLHVHADQNQIELVFRNLIHNAIKFTPEGGQIIASASLSGEFIQVDIRDTGVGISESQLASLFDEPTIRNTRGTKGERGTGLGMSLCYEMIRANGGKIRVSSVEGKGTTVHLFLKVAKTLFLF